MKQTRSCQELQSEARTECLCHEECCIALPNYSIHISNCVLSYSTTAKRWPGPTWTNKTLSLIVPQAALAASPQTRRPERALPGPKGPFQA